MRRFSIASLLAIIVLGPVAQAQGGSPQPDGRRLRLGTDSLEVYLVRGGQAQRTGLVVDQLDTVRVDGETRIRRIYRMKDAALGSSTDTIADVFSMLQPRTVRTHSDRVTEHLDWLNGRVTGAVQETDTPKRTVDSPAPAGWFGSASFDLILRASPLAPGYAVSVPAFSGRQGSQLLTAKVAGSEVMPGHGDAWRIDADFGGLSVTFWVSKSSRRLVRQVMHVAPGTEIHFVATGGPAAGAA